MQTNRVMFTILSFLGCSCSQLQYLQTNGHSRTKFSSGASCIHSICKFGGVLPAYGSLLDDRVGTRGVRVSFQFKTSLTACAENVSNYITSQRQQLRPGTTVHTGIDSGSLNMATCRWMWFLTLASCVIVRLSFGLLSQKAMKSL